MVEQLASSYGRLFDIRLLHHYWLDEGAVVFDQLSPDQQTKRLLAYDMRSFLTIAPTAATREALRSYGCLFRKTALGCVVAAPRTAAIAADGVFELAVCITSGQTYEYTALTFRPQRIYDLLSTVDGRVCRYKENVPVLSNLTGVTVGAAADTRLFLSRKIPALPANAPVESLATDGGALVQLTSDGPGASSQQVGTPASDFPVYVHQDDAPAILPPVGVSGAPPRGVELTADLPDDVFAVIRLTAVRTDNDAFSFVDGAGKPKAVPPVYQVRFKNRMTVWVYRDKRTGAVTSTEASALPLTFIGNAGTRQKPSRGHVKAEPNGTKVAKLVSEIYI